MVKKLEPRTGDGATLQVFLTAPGCGIDKKDIESLPFPSWYTDAIIDVICRVALQRSQYNHIFFYQNAALVETHVARLSRQYYPQRITAHRHLTSWCTALRAGEIDRPGAFWPCSRMGLGFLSVLFAWSPFNDH